MCDQDVEILEELEVVTGGCGLTNRQVALLAASRMAPGHPSPGVRRQAVRSSFDAFLQLLEPDGPDDGIGGWS